MRLICKVNKLNARHSWLWRVCEEGCMQAQTHTRPCCTKAIHHSTKHQRLYRGKDSLFHIVRLEACKIHSVNLSLHSQPLIHPALCHSPVSLILKPFYSFSHYSRWCLCIYAEPLIHSTLAHSLNLSPHLWPLIHSQPVSLQ